MNKNKIPTWGIKGKLNYIFVSFLLVLLLSSSMLCNASMPQLNYTYENNAWQVEYSFSNFRGEPNDQINFNIKITPKSKVYDFKVWVESPYLDIQSKHQKSNLYYETLTTGDILEDNIVISVPNTAEYGETYSVSLKIESHTNPSLGGLRILDGPEHTFNNLDNPNYQFIIKIETYPILKIEEDSPLIQQGQYNDYKIRIRNDGNGDAYDVYYNIIFPDSFEINGEVRGLLEVIPSNTYKELNLQINSLEEGEYVVQIEVESSNHQTVKKDIEFSSQNLNIYFYGTIGLFFIIIILAAIIRSFFTRDHYGY